GPGRAEPLDPTVRSYLLGGDESALPAIAQLLETIASDCSVRVIIEASHPDAVIGLPDHSEAAVEWLVALPGAMPGESLAAEVEALGDLPEHVWVAGEAACIQRLRTHLFDDRGRSRSTVTARGYWKQGRAAT
ncbi:MAG: siderophore-interacting protein, partial [Ilumatobacter sp.]